MRMPFANNRSPSLSLRKLVLRATALPLIRHGQMANETPEMRLSNTTGTFLVSTLRGLSRATARSPRCARSLRSIEIGGMEVDEKS